MACENSNSTPVQEDVDDVDVSGMTELDDKVHIKKCSMLNNAKEFLLKLQNMIGNNEWEQQFVNMWDITKDNKEVCVFLFRSNCTHLIAEIVNTFQYDNRLMEILMGILYNIVIGVQEDMLVSYDDMEIFLDLFYYTDNDNVLIQVFKFFGQVWCNGNIEIDYVEDDFCHHILLILVGVSNSEVLYEMLSCLILMCDDVEFSECIIRKDPFFLKHCVNAYKQVYMHIDDQRVDDATFTLQQYNCFYNLMSIVNNVAQSTPSNQLKAAFTLASESLLRETSIVYKFLSRDQETIESLLKSEDLFVGLLAVLSEVHPVSYQGNLFKSLLKIVINSSQSELPQNSLLTLVLYFICSTENYEQLKGDCLEVGKRRTLHVLNKFTNIGNEWNFRNNVLCAYNLHRLSRDFN